MDIHLIFIELVIFIILLLGLYIASVMYEMNESTIQILDIVSESIGKVNKHTEQINVLRKDVNKIIYEKDNAKI